MSRWWDSNPQPPLYESGALPLSYIGKKLPDVRYSRRNPAGPAPTGDTRPWSESEAAVDTATSKLRRGHHAR